VALPFIVDVAAGLSSLKLVLGKLARLLDALVQQHHALRKELSGLDFEVEIIFGLEGGAGWRRDGECVVAGRNVLEAIVVRGLALGIRVDFCGGGGIGVAAAA
jgi:hypothetical protein